MAAEDKLTIIGKYIPLAIQNSETTIHSLDQNQPGIVVFSRTRNINGTSIQIFTMNELKEIFNAPNATSYNFAVFAGNGDGNATSVHAEGVTYQNNAFHLTLATKVNGLFRVSGAVIYTPFYIKNESLS